MLDEMMLRKQNRSDRLLVLLFLYNKYMNMNRPRTESDVAVYGITFRPGFVVFICLSTTQLTLIDFFKNATILLKK
jgi:hypothetical protein